MTALHETYLNVTEKTENDFDPTGLSPEQMGRYLIERSLATETQRVGLARIALMRGEISRADYESSVARLNEVEAQAIQNGVDPSRFDGETISRGHHF